MDGRSAGGNHGGPTLTSRGRALVLAVIPLLVAARLLGAVELAGLAAGALVAVALARYQVGGHTVTYEVVRSLEPSRVEAGSPARARLLFTNSTGRAARHLTLAADALDSTGGSRGAARCLVPPLGPGEVAEVAYDLPTARRGVVTVGPLTLTVADPFGLAEVVAVGNGATRLTVLPRTETVLAVSGRAAPEARWGSARPSPVPVGLDYFTIRGYERGDDARRIHWPTTARTGELMLRLDEAAGEPMTTVLLDTRAGAHTPGSFERAVEVAASAAGAALRDGRRLRFLTTGGFELPVVGHRSTALGEFFALVGLDDHDALPRAVESLRRRPGGPVVAVLGSLAPPEVAALASVGSLALIASVGNPTPAVPGAVVVGIPPGGSFAGGWNQAVGACGFEIRR